MTETDNAGSPALRAALPFVRERLVPAYARLATLAFAYCQGSMVENLSNTSDVDTVFVWENALPTSESRPPADMFDEQPAPRVWPGQECFFSAGQEFGVAHHLVADWHTWLGELDAGRGCEGYPMPVIAAHGLQSGLLIYDPTGQGNALQRRLETFPEPLRREAAGRARRATPANLTVLEQCARLNDGLLFHGELVRAARLVWIGWFSANRRYWPLEKRLTTRLRLMGRHDLATLEERIWTSGPELRARLTAFEALAGRLLGEMPAGNDGP